MIHVQVLNLPKFQRGITALGKIGGDAVLGKGLDAGAFIVEGKMKQIVVEKDIVDTGALLNSISVTTLDGLTRSIGPSVEYAVYHEYGTSRGLAARPFAAPSIIDNKGEIVDAFKVTLLRQIKRVVR